MALYFKAEIPKGLTFMNFDKKVLKKELRKAGNPLRKRARKLVSSQGVSKPQTFPGKTSGKLASAIAVRVSRSGFSLALYENGKKFEKDGYYPAMVYYGHVAPHRAIRDILGKRVRKKNVTGKKVAAPRKNWIVSATEDFGRTEWPKVSQGILKKALKPVLIKK